MSSRESLGVVDRRNREVTALDAVLGNGAVVFGVNTGVPRSLNTESLVERALHAVLNLVEEDEGTRLPEAKKGGGIGDADGLQWPQPCRRPDAGRRVRLIGQRVDDGEGHVNVTLRNGSMNAVKHPAPASCQFVDGLEAFHGGTIERHAVGEGILRELACRHSEVLLNADQDR